MFIAWMAGIVALAAVYMALLLTLLVVVGVRISKTLDVILGSLESVREHLRPPLKVRTDEMIVQTEKIGKIEVKE